jgi:hypothetical protein
MKKPKKITVKFFLNKNLHGIEDENKQERKPLYTQITYDRKNTQIKCNYGGYYLNIEQISEESPYLLDFEETILHRTVSYELNRLGIEFRLKGLGKKYEVYCLSIHQLFNSYLKVRLKSVLQRAEPQKFLEILHIEQTQVDFFILYEASLRLFDNLRLVTNQEFLEEMDIYRVYYQLYENALQDNKYQFPVVIDWLEGVHIKQLHEKLKNVSIDNPQMTEKILQLIDKIVNTKIEMG